MWNSIEEMAIYLVCALLKVVIKNPAAVKKEHAIIAEVAQLSTEADTAVNGTAWTAAPASPASPVA